MKETVLAYKDSCEQIVFGAPLLAASDDESHAIAAVTSEFKNLKATDALVLMGHGTTHQINTAYSELDRHFKSLGHSNVFIGTVEADPTIQDLVQEVTEFHPTAIYLTPFMIVAGDHAKNDMAGEEEDSWKNIISKAGYEVQTVLKGLGEYESIYELNHLACLLSELDKSDLEKFEAVVASGEHTSGAGDLINLAENLDCYDFYIGVSDDETLGRIYAEDMEMIDIPENLRNYFDYEAYGRDMRINEDGSFVKGGFLLPNGSQFIEYYHGREDIPTNTRFLPIHSSPSGNRWQLIKKSLTVFPRRRNAHTRSKAIQTDSGTSGHFVQRCFFLEGRDLAGR